MSLHHLITNLFRAPAFKPISSAQPPADQKRSFEVRERKEVENGADELRRKFHIDVLGSFSVIKKVKWIPRTWGGRIHVDQLKF